MSAKVAIIPGVSTHREDLDAEFERGSLAVLARGFRDVLWRHVELFENMTAIVVWVGGDRQESLREQLEVEVGEEGRLFARVDVSDALLDTLREVRARNLPAEQYGEWSCDCDEYCDEMHGEGRLELFVLKPSFHELAAAQSEANEAMGPG